jgi:hypothetical protein
MIAPLAYRRGGYVLFVLQKREPHAASIICRQAGQKVIAQFWRGNRGPGRATQPLVLPRLSAISAPCTSASRVQKTARSREGGDGCRWLIELSPVGACPVVARRSDASPSSRWRTRRQWCPAVPSSFLDLPRFNRSRADKFGAHCGSGRSSLTMPQMAQGSIDWPKSTPTQ